MQSIATATKKVSVIIPAFNEEKNIAEIVRRVQKVIVPGIEKEIIVVDDASGDGTRNILKGLEGVCSVLHERNHGKGAAITTGISKASGDIILIQDADLEYDPEDYEKVIRPLAEGACDVVMGSRFLTEKPRFFTKNGDPFFSHFVGNLMIIWLTNFLFGRKFTDYEGCYKAFTRTVALTIPVEAKDFAFDNELICKSLRRGYTICEVPIRYHPRIYSEGKKIRWQHGVKILWTILKWRFLPFPSIRGGTPPERG